MNPIIIKKRSLRNFYEDIYQIFKSACDRTPVDGDILEIGSGSGFAKQIIPNLITSDVVKEPGIDLALDARQIDLPDNSLKNIFLWDSFHHISDVRSFLTEAERLMKVGGRMVIVDPYLGIFSRWIYQYFHHEACDVKTDSWTFKSLDPKQDANIALSWIVFERDEQKFKKEFPSLRIIKKVPHSPFRYWLSGGLKCWNLLPWSTDRFAKVLDEWLIQRWPKLASFWTIEIEKFEK